MKKQQKKHQKIIDDYEHMKKIAFDYYNKGNLEKALQTVFFASGFMYTMNQIQYDELLDNLLIDIADKLVSKSKQLSSIEKNVIFYDGFGYIHRGLAKAYLDALFSLGYKVKYVTFGCAKEDQVYVSSLFGKDSIVIIEKQTWSEKIVTLSEVINKSRAEKVFIYMNPDDVVGASVFSVYRNELQRYLINLTDHAYWLGRNSFDVVINFREFGGKVCASKRAINAKSIVYLPYYPIDINRKYQGLHFENPENDLVFSGGALYKTMSDDNMYYRMVERLLEKYPKVNFAYFGKGDTKKLYTLAKRFPGRVVYSTERDDFLEVMKRSTFYLSTYPYNGGLMTQYALLAKKVPLTLISPNIERELTINDKDSYWNFTSVDELLDEADKLLNDLPYRNHREINLKNFMIDSRQFTNELGYILENGDSIRKIHYDDFAFGGFVDYPIETYRGIQYCRLFFRKNGRFMFRYFPIRYLCGGLGMIIEKIWREK